MGLLSRIDTKKIESQAWDFDEKLNQFDLQRLAQASETGLAEAIMHLSLSRESRHEIRIAGTVSFELDLQCQRCLKNYRGHYRVTIDEMFTEQRPYQHMAADAGHHADEKKYDGAMDVADEQDDYFDEVGHFCLAHFVEDEILLAVPTFPVHPDEKQCYKPMVERLREKTEVQEDVTDNPFAVLKNLK